MPKQFTGTTQTDKIKPVHEFEQQNASYIFVQNDYILLQLKEKIQILDSMIRGKTITDFNLLTNGIATFCPELYYEFRLPDSYINRKAGTIYIGLKNCMERDLIIDPYQLIGYLQIQDYTNQEKMKNP